MKEPLILGLKTYSRTTKPKAQAPRLQIVRRKSVCSTRRDLMQLFKEADALFHENITDSMHQLFRCTSAQRIQKQYKPVCTRKNLAKRSGIIALIAPA